MNVAVIGAGIFGVTIAVRLSRESHINVTLFERQNDKWVRLGEVSSFN